MSVSLESCCTAWQLNRHRRIECDPLQPSRSRWLPPWLRRMFSVVLRPNSVEFGICNPSARVFNESHVGRLMGIIAAAWDLDERRRSSLRCGRVDNNQYKRKSRIISFRANSTHGQVSGHHCVLENNDWEHARFHDRMAGETGTMA
jgi:hypothetical protein